nr:MULTISPECIES: UPF0175 family protein [unclassified Coleofasciculus]
MEFYHSNRFELGKLSSGRAAQLAGISRVEFLMLLGRYQVSPFSLTTKELEHGKGRSLTSSRSRGSEPKRDDYIATPQKRKHLSVLGERRCDIGVGFADRVVDFPEPTMHNARV